MLCMQMQLFHSYLVRVAIEAAVIHPFIRAITAPQYLSTYP